MAITSGVEFASPSNKEETLGELLKRKDNVIDLQNSKLKDSDESTADNERDLVVNKLVEEDFDAFFLANQAKVADFVAKGTYDTAGVAWIRAEFELYIKSHKLNAQIDKREDAEIRTIIDETKFKLEELKEEIEYLKAHNDTKSETKDLKQDIQTPGTTDKQNPKETLVEKTTYGYKPETFDFQELGPKGKIAFEYDDIDAPTNEQDILNIYKKGGLHKEMEKIFGGLGELSPRDFKINLSPVNGLAGLILHLEKNPDLWDKIDSGKDIKRYGFAYDREGGRDHERGKLADIIKYAQGNEDFKIKLVAFAREVEGFGPEYEKRLKQSINFSNAPKDADHILKSLCDYNGDGILSVQYRDYTNRKQHREQWKKDYQERNKSALPSNWKDLWRADWFAVKEKQKMSKGENQGDVGAIFGPQLYDAMQTAVKLSETKIKHQDTQFLALHPGVTQGENIVLFNVLKNIDIANTDPKIRSAIQEISEDKATFSELSQLCETYPAFQPLFAQTIERINGSSHTLAPDLVDRLLGIDRIPVTYPSLQQKLDNNPFRDVFVSLGKNSATGEKITLGSPEFIQMKKGLMTFLDNVHIDAMMNDEPKLLSLGISKSRDINKKRHEIENSFMKDLLGALASVTFNPATLTVGFVFGQSGTTGEKLKDKYARNGGVSNVLGTPILSVHIGGEFAHQFNYPQVVTSSLDDLHKAKYIGVEAGASEIFVGIAPMITVGEVGLNYQKDSKAAIEQVYKQYSDVISEVFAHGITKEGMSSQSALETTLLTHLEEMQKTFITKKPLMEKFIVNNRKYFETNIKQLAQYFERSGLRAALQTAEKPLEAAQTLLDIYTQGITNEWRETMYQRIAGKTEISKVSAGLGGMFIADVFPLIYPKIGLSLRHRRNNYISRQDQKLLDAKLINAGGIDQKDIFLPQPPSVEAYATYIDAIYSLRDNEGKSLLEVKEDPKGHISLTATQGNISDIIDIRSKVQQKVLDNCAFSADGKTLIMGDVGNITAYTQSDGLGKRCFLVLGGEGTTKTCRLPSTHNSGKTLNAPMTFTSKTTEVKSEEKADTQTPESTETQVEKTISFESLLTTETQAEEKIMKDMVTVLMNSEKNSPAEYKKLIQDTSEGLINADKLSQGVSTLIKMLGNKFPALAGKLKSTETPAATKAYIVDRCKQIFAKEPEYARAKIGQIVSYHATSKMDALSLKGPSGETMDADLMDELKTQRTLWSKDTHPYTTPTQDETILGYSAFYRRGKGKNQYISKNFSLTSLGGTGYQGELYTIKNHPEKAKDWVLGNLKKNEQEMKTFKEHITALCAKENITIDLGKKDAIEQLIDGTLPIDNTDKKVRLNVDRVFYLLGECCNESLGMKIKGIDITTSQDVVEPGNGTPPPETPPVVTYENSTHIGGRNLSSGMKAGAYGEDLSMSIGLIRTEKGDSDSTTPGAETPDGDITGPGLDTPDTPPIDPSVRRDVSNGTPGLIVTG